MNPTRWFLGAAAIGLALFAGYHLGYRAGANRSVPSAHAGRSPQASSPTAAKPSAMPAPGGAPLAGDSDTTAGSARTPGQILAGIATLKIGANQPKNTRQLLAALEQLKQLGAAALPALRDFLAGGQDADYDAVLGKMGAFKDGKVPADFIVPPSLRLALLEVTKNIGGPEAEALLARELKATGRGVEAAYIAAALEQVAPGKYSSAATAAARDLLAMPLSSTTKNLLDRADREYLYHILAAAGDASQVPQAQAHLLLPNGQLDRGALHYLQEALGPGAIDVALRAWNDPRMPTNQREPLARVALTFAGVDDRADRFYQVAINDPNLSPSARKNLIEDLNQDGFTNPKQLSPADLTLIQRRLALIENLAPKAKDPVSVAAFAEAKKDLLAMQEKAQRPPKK